jgi:small-conductance mechanosensitive channel
VEEIFDRAAGELGESLPRIAGAIVLLVLGLIAARIAGSIIGRTLHGFGIDALADKYNVHATIGRAGIQPPVSRLLARIARLVLSLVVVVAAISLLGLAGVNVALNEALLFIPKLLAAVVIAIAGIIVGELIGRWVDGVARQLAIDAPAGRVAQAVVVALFLLTALAQIGVPTQVLAFLVGIVLLAGALTLTLAFGLGGRDVAKHVSAGRYVQSAFELGQEISLGELRAEIVAFEAATTVLRTSSGDIARVPNHVLIDSIVLVHPAQQRASS